MGRTPSDLSHWQDEKGFGDQDLLWPSKVFFGAGVGHRQKEERTGGMAAPNPMVS